LAQYEGRLELTWTNKRLALLADEQGNYEWVPPSDYRVAEVRLLDDAGSVGETRPMAHRAQENLLIRGDALNALRALGELPEFADELVGKVKLAYLDPPFNTQESFLHYDDALEHSVWLTMMRDRLVQVKRLLSRDGSVWVHCDDSEQAYLKMLLDELFGRQAFIATIVWQNRYSRDSRPAIGPVHNYILVYAPMGTDWKHIQGASDRAVRR
jgi:adenine-specific DNA-methyltransferase